MTYQAYLDTIKAKTGKTPEDFRKLAAKKKLTKYPEIMTWLKSDFELGHGHANASAHEIVNADAPKVTQDEAITNCSQVKRKNGEELMMFSLRKLQNLEQMLLWELQARTSASCAAVKNLALSCLLPSNDWISASNSKVFHRLRGSNRLERGTTWSLIECASLTRNK